MSRLILLRHGQSVWNKENRFTGFADVELSEKGRNEAESAGKILLNEKIDIIFTSVLKRAIATADIAEALLPAAKRPRICNAALNERNYGDLQGLNKDEMRQKFGVSQVAIWRRGFDVSPPGGESLKQTCERVIPYYLEYILPHLKRGKNVLIVAHGNSLRGLMMELEKLDDKAIVNVEIPTGVPISYDIDTNGIAKNKIVYGPKEIE